MLCQLSGFLVGKYQLMLKHTGNFKRMEIIINGQSRRGM